MKNGHPKGLYFLFTVEMWERFSYYGMRAILVLYMVKYLMFNTEKAGHIYGIYTGLVYATPLIGGYIADRYLGSRKCILAGGILMALGHFAMAFPNIKIFYIALGLLILGNGFFKPNISSIVGQFTKPMTIAEIAVLQYFIWELTWSIFLAASLRNTWRKIQLSLWFCRCGSRNAYWTFNLYVG